MGNITCFKISFEESINILHCVLMCLDVAHQSKHKKYFNTLNTFHKNRNLKILLGGYKNKTYYSTFTKVILSLNPTNQTFILLFGQI